jgi:hypothetical protein
MKRPAPGGVTALGVMNIVIGALLLSCCSFTVVVSVAGGGIFEGDFNREAMEEFLSREIPVYHFVKWGSMALGFLCFLMLLVTGIGLVNRGGWARILSIATGFVLIPFVLSVGIYDLVLEAPAVSRFFRQMFPFGAHEVISFIWLQYIAQTIVYILLLVYSIVMDSVLMGARVRSFFSESPFGQAGFFPEDDWDDPPRREPRRGWDDDY